MLEKKQIGKSTLSIWAGEQEHELYERSTQVPVVHSVSFAYKDIDTWQKVALEETEGHIYSRNTNPTVRAFEDKVKELETELYFYNRNKRVGELVDETQSIKM